MGSGERSTKGYLATLLLLLFPFSLNGHTLFLPQGFKKINCLIVHVYPHKILSPLNRYQPEYAFTNGKYYPGKSSTWCGYTVFRSILKVYPEENYSEILPINEIVTSVSGCWKVPVIAPSKTPKGTYAAICVGMDGHWNDALEQIGTMHNWRESEQEDYAWFQVDLADPQIILDFPMEKGDLLGAEIEHIGHYTYRLLLINYTKKVCFELPSIASMTKEGEHNSAEWVVSAAFSPSIGGLPLSSFGMIEWSHCQTIINGKKGSIRSAEWETERIDLQPKDDALKAISSELQNQSQEFSVQWVSE